MFPPSRQTRPGKGELKVITIRHHKIVLRGVAHIKLVFWIAFLWKLRNVRIFLNGWNCFYLYWWLITRIAIVLIEMRDGCFVHVFERPEGLGCPVWGWVRPRPRLIIPRLTADTEARTHFAAKTRGSGWSRSLLTPPCDVGHVWGGEVVWCVRDVSLWSMSKSKEGLCSQCTGIKYRPPYLIDTK